MAVAPCRYGDYLATPAEMIELIETALLQNPGAVSVRFSDGRQITYDRAQAIQELEYWKRQQAAAASTTGGLQMQRMSLLGDA